MRFNFCRYYFNRLEIVAKMARKSAHTTLIFIIFSIDDIDGTVFRLNRIILSASIVLKLLTPNMSYYATELQIGLLY